ncbi:MAG: isoprenylcysteine carboxylmethyltransferase family protein [Rhodobacteraceae bacterium]|nr:isoprenylcysteine carboxylmethyltransferase family protein [Paracoccaceae bacterium]
MLRYLDYPPVWLAGAIALVWGQAWLWPPTRVSETLASGGAALLLAGVVLMGAAAWQFRRHQTTIVPHRAPSALITDGVYAYSRNPIYLADALILGGIGAILGAWATLVVLPAFVWVIGRRFITPEEMRLAQAFGARFEEWAGRVRRWL